MKSSARLHCLRQTLVLLENSCKPLLVAGKRAASIASKIANETELTSVFHDHKRSVVGLHMRMHQLHVLHGIRCRMISEAFFSSKRQDP